jgi:phage terminase small subunit
VNQPLSAQERTFVDACALGQSTMDAAKSTGISYSTAKRWLKRPEIRSALQGTLARVEEQAEQTAAEIIISKYKEALEPACDAVVSIVKDSMESGATRLKAAQMIQDRLAPILKQIEQPQPEQEVIPRDLLQYLTEDELTMIDQAVQSATNRKAQAEQDREKLRA